MTAPRRQSAADIAARFVARRAERSPVPQVDPVAQAEHDRLLQEASRARGFVDGWKGIATVLDRSERWCRDMAVRASDPLPTFKLGGIVRLNLADLEEWLERQRAAGMRPAIEPDHGATAPEEHW